MNPDTTEQNINQAIDWLQKTGGQIQEFTAEQAPLYCREVVAWQLWSSIAGVVGSLLIAAAAVYIAAKSRRWIAENVQEVHPGAIFGSMAILAAIVLSFVGIYQNAQSAIKAVVAPRMVIVEHLRGLKP